MSQSNIKDLFRINISNGSIGAEGNANIAKSGGGVYVSGGDVLVTDSGSIKYNTAEESGGGAYLAGGTLNVSGGSIANNESVNGAGAYLAGGEGCLSVEKEHEGYIYRKFFVTIEGYDYLTKSHIRKKFRGYPAIVVQHEMDHFDGKLFYDHINKKDPFKVKENAIQI